MRTNIVILALVAVGCGDTHAGSGVSPVVDGHVEESGPDSGQNIDESPPRQNPGDAPDADAQIEEQAPSSDAALADAGHSPSEDAGEESPADASVAMCTGEPSEPATFGTAQEPIALALGDAPFEGAIDWRGRAFARISGLSEGERYLITATADSAVLLSVHADDPTFTDADCLAGDDVRVFSTYCFVNARRESIDVAVDALYTAASFELTIVPAYASEGTPEAPIQVAQSALPYSLEVGSREANAYEITGLTPGIPHVVSVRAASGPVRLMVFGSESMGDSVADQQLSNHARAVGTPVGTSLRVTVQALQAVIAQTTAQLDVWPATRQAEGSAVAPVQIAESALPYDGEVGWAYNTMPIPSLADGVSQSFYAITGLTPGAYEVSLGSDVVEPVNLHLYGDDGAFTGVVGVVTAAEGVPARRTVRITGSVLYVKVVNLGGEGTPFTLDVEPSTRSSQGSAGAPVEIALAELPYSGSIELGQDSYYAISGLTPGQAYLAHVSDVSASPVGITLFADSAGPFTAPACEVQAQTNGSGLPCKVTPTGSSIHVRARVLGSGSAVALGSVFALSLEPIVEASEGTPQAPIVIDCPAGSYTGRIGTNGSSYYEITGLEAGVAYLVEAEPAEDAVVLQVFSGAATEPFYDSERCDNYDSPVDYPSRCVETSASGSLFVQLSGYARGAAVEIAVRPAMSGSEGIEDAPIVLELDALPYAGRVSGAAPSFYAFNSVDIDTAYIARVTSLLERLDIELYSDGGVASPHGVAVGQVLAGRPLERIFLPTDSTAYLRAALPNGADGVSEIELDLSPAPHQAEGVDAPLALSLGELPRTSSADATRLSRYEIRGLTPGQSYVATIANASEPMLIMEAYEDWNPVFDTVCASDVETGTSADCTFTPFGESVRLEVRVVQALSASFELDVQASE